MKNEMKNEPSRTLREVWALKRAVEEETRGMSTLEALRYIRRECDKLKLNLPAATCPRRRRPVSRPKS